MPDCRSMPAVTHAAAFGLLPLPGTRGPDPPEPNVAMCARCYCAELAIMVQTGEPG
jgi:hypothetical protein